MITVKAYAKINLDLYVKGRRDNGYHDLVTCMHTIDIFDEVTVTRNDTGLVYIECDDHSLPADDKNTAYRAAGLMQSEFGLKSGYCIHIKKSIPQKAGLGGSSADAAAVINAIDALEGLNLKDREKFGIGVRIGADVPFQTLGGCARCLGVGEIISPLEPLPECSILLVLPGFGVSTAWAFKEFDRRRAVNAVDMSGDMDSALSEGDLEKACSFLHNDLEPIAASEYEDIRMIREALLRGGALGALMSGSGSGVYGIFAGRQEACDCAGVIKDSLKVAGALVVGPGQTFER